MAESNALLGLTADGMRTQILSFFNKTLRLHFATCREVYLMLLARSQRVEDVVKADWCLSQLSSLDQREKETIIPVPEIDDVEKLNKLRKLWFNKMRFEIEQRRAIVFDMLWISNMDRQGINPNLWFSKLERLVAEHRACVIGGEPDEESNRIDDAQAMEYYLRQAREGINAGSDFENSSDYTYKDPKAIALLPHMVSVKEGDPIPDPEKYVKYGL